MTGFLILIALVIGVGAIIQLVRLNEVASELSTGREQEEIGESENNILALTWPIFMVAFLGFMFWMMAKYGYGGLGPSASAHGVELDWVLQMNYWIIIPVAVICNVLLAYFAYKYRYSKDRKAAYFLHSSKLEMLWTAVPAVVLAVIIFMGLKTWRDIMIDSPNEGQPTIVEVYAKQFGWNFRLSGENNKLGQADYKLIGPATDFVDINGAKKHSNGNPLGIVTMDFIYAKYADIDNSLETVNKQLEEAKGATGEYWESEEIIDKLLTKKSNLELQKSRIKAGLELSLLDSTSNLGSDDIFLDEDLYLVVNRPVSFQFRSRDVIHSAWFPHFRAQMNCTPGTPTYFTFTPIYTTAEMRTKPEVQAHYKEINTIHNERLKSLGEEEEVVEMNFILLCNKICGAGHYNMQKNIVVVTEEEYEKWYECIDFKEANPTQPRLDVNGNPAVYEGWRSDSDESLVNHTNMATGKES